MPADKTSYFRPEIEKIHGYTPGEQPKIKDIIKLNTNENPYPPSPKVTKVLESTDIANLRRYPDPACSALRDQIASLHNLDTSNVILGNGSDDILTIAIRSFVGQGEALACVDPTYSLYEVLANIQGAKCIKTPLNDDFTLPNNLLEKIKGAKLFLIPRPNAPTGNSFALNSIEEICRNFDGVVLIDEAYADFAEDNCMDFVKRFPNVVVTRTVSKSYSLAGIRLGYAVASESLITGMMKVKDSYNVNQITQEIALVALKDQKYFHKTVSMIKNTRKNLTQNLLELGFEIIPSETNFIFASPPDGNGEQYFNALRNKGIIVRYFPGQTTGKYVRITIGTDQEAEKLYNITKAMY